MKRRVKAGRELRSQTAFGRLRRDINDLVRDEKGALSPSRVGTLLGQWLAIKLLLLNGKEIIANWDSLTVLFSVLIAPELFKKMIKAKYGEPPAVKE